MYFFCGMCDISLGVWKFARLIQRTHFQGVTIKNIFNKSLYSLYITAVITYRTLRSTTKYQAKLIHAAFQAIGFIFAVLGLIAVFRSHNEAKPKIPNAYSLHSWIGLGATVLFSAQVYIMEIKFWNISTATKIIEVFCWKYETLASED